MTILDKVNQLEIVAEVEFGRTFETRFMSREEWVAYSVLRDYAIFTDGSKTETGLSFIIFSDNLDTY